MRGTKYCDSCAKFAGLRKQAIWRSKNPTYNADWVKANKLSALEISQRREIRRKMRQAKDPAYIARQAEKQAKRDAKKLKTNAVPARRRRDQLLECPGCKRMLPHGRFERVAWNKRTGTITRRRQCRACAAPERNARSHKRRAQEGTFTVADIRALEKRQNMMCACNCGRSLHLGYHIDHIVPLARGGTNWPSNLQLLTKLCNLRKGAKNIPPGVPIPPAGPKRRGMSISAVRDRLRSLGVYK